MICKNCKKSIEAGEAFVCPRCSSNYCPDCAQKAVLCDCAEKLSRYS
ncbi:MAG: hypothetical protein LBP26_07325 [Clostridiales bacterium]|nr:hypothetical protein [Clostridiales bacterium]